MSRSNSNDTANFADAFYGMKSDYQAMKQTRLSKRLTGVSSMGSGADYHLKNESGWLRMLERARWHDRNDAIAGQGVNRLCDNVLQDGFRLDPQSGNDDIDALISKRFAAWANSPEDCHKAGRFTFDRLAWLTLRHVVVDGDLFHLPLADGHLEPVEAHRCRTPRRTKRNVANGVLLDKFRHPLEYWFTKDDIDPLRPVANVGDIRAYNAKSVIHVANPERISQTRGISAFAPCMDYIGMHGDIQFAQLVKQQMACCFAIIRQLDGNTPDIPGSRRFGNQETETLAGGSTRTIEGMSPGIFIDGAPGESYTGFSPNIPNAEFFQHATLILTFIAINLGIPVAVLLLDPSNTNFSGWRGAIDQARIGFRRIQKWLKNSFHEPVYQWKIQQWLNEDPEFAAMVNAAGADPFAHRWNPPAWDYIEPLKDANADKIIQTNRLNSPRRIHAQRGRDWDEVAKEIVDDNAKIVSLAITKAQELNKTDPTAGVDWRELASFDLKGKSDTPAIIGDGNTDSTGAVIEGGAARIDFEAIGDTFNAYGVGVRAGALTPQADDENSFRELLGIPAASDDVKKVWSDETTRRPITLSLPGGGSPNQAQPTPQTDDNDKDGDDEK